MAKIITTSPAPISAGVLRRAADDFSTLGTVFGWLDAMFASIVDAAEKGECTPESRLHRIRELAHCGRYLTGDWSASAEDMAIALRDELSAQTEGLSK